MKRKMRTGSRVKSSIRWEVSFINVLKDILGKFMQLPMNRVRQICQLDQEDYTLVSKQALVLITKATELFVQDLAGVCG